MAVAPIKAVDFVCLHLISRDHIYVKKIKIYLKVGLIAQNARLLQNGVERFKYYISEDSNLRIIHIWNLYNLDNARISPLVLCLIIFIGD